MSNIQELKAKVKEYRRRVRDRKKVIRKSKRKLRKKNDPVMGLLVEASESMLELTQDKLHNYEDALEDAKEAEADSKEVVEFVRGLSKPSRHSRHIPREIRQEVWRRDKGQCTNCGSTELLEFDHIIPVAKGGSSTARNVQLLCDTCNRAKADNI